MVLRGVKLFSGARVTLASVVAVLLLGLIAPIASAETESAPPSLPPSPIVINEVKPGVTRIDGKINTDRWIELYNKSSEPVDISDYRVLRGAGSNALGRVVPEGTILQPKGYHLLVLDNSVAMPLNSRGSELKLWSNKPNATVNPGVKLDTVDYGVVEAGNSYGRIYDGAKDFRQFTKPTEGETNYVASPVTPTNLRIRNGDTALTEGQYTSNRNVTVAWDIPSGSEATQYEIRLRHESGEATRQTAGATFALTDLLTQDGTWSVQVRAQDVISPDWSDWSPSVTFKLDTVRPVVALTGSLLLVDPRTPYILRASASDAGSGVNSIVISLRIKGGLESLWSGAMTKDPDGEGWSLALPEAFARYGSQYDVVISGRDLAGNEAETQTWSLSFALPILSPPIESGQLEDLDDPEDQNRETPSTTFTRYETPYSPAVAVQYYSLDDADITSDDKSQDVIGAHRTNTQPSGSVNTSTGFAWQWIVAAAFVFGAGFVGWAVLGRNRE